ncbi:MAG: hypothetical protein RI922_1631 [Bacteroidota bacterium]|jgi:hypothetical protein
MAFNGTEGTIITLAEGAAMTAAWRRTNTNGNAVFYGKNIINQLLAQPGVVGIRFHFGIDTDGKNTLVLVGVDANENDVLSIIADRGVKCPVLCGNKNGLNSVI